ncbi:MAG TPA: tetratricopeptide repeat protein [Vicinamibacterales bacterium]|nr:tetratricopeptide repeat protein [Vicinamibacterales bacterium]
MPDMTIRLSRRRCAALVLVLLGLSPAAAMAQQNQANPYYEFLHARRLEAAGDADGALASLQRAANADPASAEIKAEIAALHFRKRPVARVEAEKAAKEALAIDAKNVEANSILGYLYATSVDNARAASASPDDIKNAVTHLERAVAGTIGIDLQMQYTLGRMYLRNNEPQKAVQVISKVVAQSPANESARRLLAAAHVSAGNLKGAIATLSEVIDFVPELAADLARYLEQDGQMREAAAAYTVALAEQPSNRELKLQRILALMKAREFTQAAAFAGEARKQHPDDLNFTNFQAQALFEAGDRNGAIALAEASAKANPRDLQTQLTLATLYSDAGRTSEALTITESAAKTFPNNKNVQFMLADAYADAGRTTDAERVLRQMLASDPSNARLLNHLGYMLANRGEQLDEAVTLVRRALAVDPDRPEYLDSLGWAHFKRGELNEAVKYLMAAADKLPTNSEVQDHLGDVYARRGSLQEAIAAWNKALAGDGQGIEKAAVERKLEDARRKLPR